MTRKILITLLATILASATAIADEPEEPKSNPSVKSDRWFVSYEVSSFSRNAGITVDEIPEGTSSYRKTFNIAAPKFAIGYKLTPSKWACEFQLQLGPRESFEAFKDGEVLNPAESVRSHFLSASANRTFNVRDGYEFEAKIGVVNASFLNRTQAKGIEQKHSFSETKPMASIGLHKRFAPNLSLGLEFTNYFLSKTGSVSTGTIGLRYHF